MDFTKERPPFGRLQIPLRRIANFVGTTNKKEILSDETGNVRWIIVAIVNFFIQINTNLYKKIQSWENAPPKNQQFKKRIIFAQISSNARC
jgi:predicted P-loop ATPase